MLWQLFPPRLSLHPAVGLYILRSDYHPQTPYIVAGARYKVRFPYLMALHKPSTTSTPQPENFYHKL